MKNIRLIDLESQYKKIEKEVNNRIKKVVAGSHFILGEEVEKFEEEFAGYCGTKYCVGLDNGGSALELGIRALGIKNGDEVITPVNSFIASSSSISFTGAAPVWVDCDEKTYNIDASKIESKITKKTKAIMPVHLYGQMADMDKIVKIAKKHKLFIIEDACQAHGAAYKGKKAGSFGDFAAFSFYPGKNLGAYGDGGAIVTNNKKIYNIIKTMRNYGQSKKYYHDYLAWNRRLDALQAGILRVKLKYLDEWNRKRRENAKIYKSWLGNIDKIVLPFTQDYNEHSYHLFVIRTKKRDQLRAYLSSKGIETGIHYPIPIHKQKAYENYVLKDYALPVAEKYAKEVLSLPMCSELKISDIKRVCLEIKNFFNETYSKL